jgi:hypothetical protein
MAVYLLHKVIGFVTSGLGLFLCSNLCAWYSLDPQKGPNKYLLDGWMDGWMGKESGPRFWDLKRKKYWDSGNLPRTGLWGTFPRDMTPEFIQRLLGL